MKKKLLFLLLLVSFFIPGKTLALSGDVLISCDKTSAKIGERIVCTVDGNSDGFVSSIFANISADGSVKIEKFRAEHIWEIKSEWPNLSLHSTTKKPGNFEIGTVYLKAVSAGVGNFVMSGISFIGDDGSNASPVNKTISINVISDNPTPSHTPEPEPEPAPVVKSSDSSLKSLAVSSGSIDFVPGTLEYNLDVSSSVSTIEIQAVPNNTKATVKLPDKLSLETGINTFLIVVTAEDGSTTTYKINVNKLETILSENALLSILSISGYTIDFKNDVFEYKIGNITTNKLDISVTAIDNNAKIKIFGNDNIGKDGVIIIRVTAEAGNYKDYILYVNNINAGDTDEISTSSLTYLMLIVSSALFVISAIIIVLLLVGRNKYRKKVLAQLEDEKKKIQLLEVELQNKLAMIPPAKEEEEAVPLEEITKEKIEEEFDKEILEKRDEGKRGEEVVIDAKKVDDVEEVVGKKKEEKDEKKDIDSKDVLESEVNELVNKETKNEEVGKEPDINAKDVLEPEVSKLVNSKSDAKKEEVGEELDIDARDILPPEVSALVKKKSEVVSEDVKEDDAFNDNVMAISAESVASVVKKSPKTEEVDSKDKTKHGKKTSKKGKDKK